MNFTLENKTQTRKKNRNNHRNNERGVSHQRTNLKTKNSSRMSESFCFYLASSVHAKSQQTRWVFCQRTKHKSVNKIKTINQCTSVRIWVGLFISCQDTERENVSGGLVNNFRKSTQKIVSELLRTFFGIFIRILLLCQLNFIDIIQQRNLSNSCALPKLLVRNL